MTQENPPEEGKQPDEGLDELKKKLLALQSDLSKKDVEAKQLQSRADKAEQRLDRIVARPPTKGIGAVPPQGPPPARTLPQQPQSQQQPTGPTAAELQQIAMDKSREVVLLREVMARGLALEDIEGIDFESQSELKMKLDLLQQQREIEQLKQSLAVQAGASEEETPPKATPLRVDTGGQSGVVADAQVQKVDKFRNTAKDLRKKGMHLEATWMSLRAAHSDPAKRSLVRKEETDES